MTGFQVLVIGAHPLALPVISHLLQSRQCAGIVLHRMQQAERAYLAPLAESQQIPCHIIDPTHFRQSIFDILTQSRQIEAVYVLGFPYRIPSELLSIPPKGWWNFHFGRLPSYRGSDPIFWQIRNRETQGALCVHKMTDQILQGPLAYRQSIPIYPEETYGMHATRVIHALPEAISYMNRLLTRPTDPMLLDQEESYIIDANSPTAGDLVINWDLPRSEILALIRAANPGYGGARSLIKQWDIRILDAAEATGSDFPQVAPGTIVKADRYHGLWVLCKDRTQLKIRVAATVAGVLSGKQLINLGFRVGDRFESNPPKDPSISIPLQQFSIQSFAANGQSTPENIGR
ncbi:formyltransferase family protein [Pontibacter sp. G13]|uniref:methionyl-tRNA formyltransferase n=1 Tax=Pontibacter sp. G13 TaxID=3074898 RepID=UPI00288C11CE|nr:formyltransferase family protein [Pontibacter sp. G13]WNJ18955.1 formyltransferase family protein [Pontibacter sp. G13]